MFGISGCKRSPSRHRDARNLSVTNIDWPPLSSAGGSKRRGGFGSGEIEGRDLPLQILVKKFGEGLFELGPAASVRHRQQAEANLENRDGGRPDRYRCLPIEP